MRKLALFIVLALPCSLLAQQVDNTIHVGSFPGTTVGAKVSAAMATCTTSTIIPCILVIDPSMASFPPGSLPTPCSHCYISDWRNGPPSGGGGGTPGTPVSSFQFNKLGAFGGSSKLHILTSGDASGATDLTAINNACTATGDVDLACGTFYVNGPLSACGALSNVIVEGCGQGLTTITNVGTTNFVFPENYCITGSDYLHVNIALFRNFSIVQSGTPTAGGGFQIGCSTSGSFTQNVHLENVTLKNLWNALDFEGNQQATWVTDSLIYGAANYSIYYNAIAGPGSGDNWFNNLNVRGLGFGSGKSNILFTQTDTQTFDNLKLNNGVGIVFTGVTNFNEAIRFNNGSFEGMQGAGSCAFDFGVGNEIHNVYVTGEHYGAATLFCHVNNVNGLGGFIVNNSATSDYPLGFINFGFTGMVPASLPVLSPGTGTYTGTQSVSISCSSGTPYYLASGVPTAYSSPISVSVTGTIQAECLGSGYTPSFQSATYTISGSLASVGGVITSGSGNTVTTSSGTLTVSSGGSIACLFFSNGASTVSSVSDGTNTYSAVGSQQSLTYLTSGYAQWFLASNITGISGATVTVTTAATIPGFSAVQCWAIPGIVESFDTTAGVGHGTTTGGTSVTTGNFNTGFANEVVLAAAFQSGSLTANGTAGTGYTLDAISLTDFYPTGEHIIYSSTQTGVAADMTFSSGNLEIVSAGFGH